MILSREIGMKNIATFLVLLFASSSISANAQLRCGDETDLELRQNVFSKSDEDESNELWDNWFKKTRTEFPNRVTAIYAALHWDKQRPQSEQIYFDIDGEKKTILVRERAQTLFSHFCQQALGRLMEIPTFEPPRSKVTNPKQNLFIVFKVDSKIVSEVKPQSLTDKDVEYLLTLDSSAIKSLLNLPPAELRKALDSRATATH